MHPARPLLAALLAFGLSSGLAQAKDWTHVRVATEGAYPPFNSTTADGKVIGYEPDLLKAVCDRLKITCDTVVQDWDGLIPGLKAGKFDAIMSGMSITPKREEAIAFTVPYSQGPSTFAVMAGGPLASLPSTGVDLDLADHDAAMARLAPLRDALKGKVVGVQVATIQADLMAQYLPGVEVRSYKTNDEVALDLEAGRVDAWIGSQTNLSAGVKAAKGGLAYAGPLFKGGLLGKGSGMGLRKDDADLKALLDRGLVEAMADGTAGKLSQQWFGFDIVPR
ncbi:transporter substrate-binding domain-containing protein [Lichenibacterium minor]|uniref:Transporter substrate-binding domain-containing protein n=2 Tax=Lichenibacterium minor TaxID=2316528 RepID=A0A4Q2U9W6_9HYPH|nr:transporter substrate-binding domain-containing protein [Lichenibacterium minor]